MMHRHSLTYRGAVLNLKRYRLRPASSCPDIISVATSVDGRGSIVSWPFHYFLANEYADKRISKLRIQTETFSCFFNVMLVQRAHLVSL